MAESSNCIICLEALSSACIGAAVPCGHCFHHHCFGQWEASRESRGRSTPCPTCNGKTIMFTKLFLDLEPDDDNDDDDSLSCSSSVETRCPEVTDESDSVAQEPLESQGSDQEEQNEAEQDQVVIEIDDNSVIELVSNPPSPLPPSTPKRPANDKDPTQIRRKAKRLKRENKRLMAQRKDLVERERKLLEEFSETRERLGEIQDELEERIEAEKSDQLELQSSRLDLVRVR